MTRIFRLLLFPFMAWMEILLLVFAWILLVVHPSTAARVIRIAERFPDPKWYWPTRQRNSQRNRS